jgi:hypothetical protein
MPSPLITFPRFWLSWPIADWRPEVEGGGPFLIKHGFPCAFDFRYFRSASGSVSPFYCGLHPYLEFHWGKVFGGGDPTGAGEGG